jgi:hypothetical protein
MGKLAQLGHRSPSAHAHRDLLPATQSRIVPPASPPGSTSLLFASSLPPPPSSCAVSHGRRPTFLSSAGRAPPRSNKPRMFHAQACTSRSVMRDRASRDLGPAYLICARVSGQPRRPARPASHTSEDWVISIRDRRSGGG